MNRRFLALLTLSTMVFFISCKNAWMDLCPKSEFTQSDSAEKLPPCHSSQNQTKAENDDCSCPISYSEPYPSQSFDWIKLSLLKSIIFYNEILLFKQASHSNSEKFLASNWIPPSFSLPLNTIRLLI